jgi:hypothetical protein
MSLYVRRVVGFLYVQSRRHFYNLTNMRWKPSACFGLHMGMVPNAYQCKSDDFYSRRLSRITSGNRTKLVNLAQYYTHCNGGVARTMMG